MADGLKSRNKLMYNLMKLPILSRGYIAQKMYGDDVKRDGRTNYSIREASAKLHQKVEDKSTISDEDLIKLYDILREEYETIQLYMNELDEHFEFLKKSYELKKEMDKKIAKQADMMKKLDSVEDAVKKKRKK